MHEDLRKHITSRLSAMTGSWIGKNSGYEPALCEVVGFLCQRGRYHDATWCDYTLELKKGKTGVWLNLVRYSEELIEFGPEGRANNLTLVFVTDSKANTIAAVIGVTTAAIIKRVNLDTPSAQFLVNLSSRVPRQLNAQANLTVKDLREIATFEVGMLDDLLLE
jgi:hypothetical protein